MDLGRVGLFIVVGGVSIYFGLKQGRMSMMIIGIVIAAVGILNIVMQSKKSKDDKEDE